MSKIDQHFIFLFKSQKTNPNWIFSRRRCSPLLMRAGESSTAKTRASFFSLSSWTESTIKATTTRRELSGSPLPHFLDQSANPVFCHAAGKNEADATKWSLHTQRRWGPPAKPNHPTPPLLFLSTLEMSRKTTKKLRTGKLRVVAIAPTSDLDSSSSDERRNRENILTSSITFWET